MDADYEITKFRTIVDQLRTVVDKNGRFPEFTAGALMFVFHDVFKNYIGTTDKNVLLTEAMNVLKVIVEDEEDLETLIRTEEVGADPRLAVTADF